MRTTRTGRTDYVARGLALLSMKNQPVSPFEFGAIGDGIADDHSAIQRAITYSIRTNRTISLLGARSSWRITRELDFTDVRSGIGSLRSPISVDPNGDYPFGWAVRFGDPRFGAFIGRSQSFSWSGCLAVNSVRGPALGGIYMKTALSNIDSIRVQGFNGAGFFGDSVWDSVVGRTSVELCGSTTDYAFVLASNGDTSNTSHFTSVQVEQAVQRAMHVDVLRFVVDNIHAERTTLLDSSDASFVFNLTNSQVNQAVLHASTPNFGVVLNGNRSSYNEIYAEGAKVRTDNPAEKLILRNVLGKTYTKNTAADVTQLNCQFTG